MIGATIIDRPSAKRARPGMPATQKRERSSTSISVRIPQPMRVGPTVRKSRGPRRSASAPNRVAKRIMKTLVGVRASPDANGEKPRNCR